MKNVSMQNLKIWFSFLLLFPLLIKIQFNNRIPLKNNVIYNVPAILFTVASSGDWILSKKF